MRFPSPVAVRSRSAVRLAAALLLLSCGGDEGTGPSGPRPTTIVVEPAQVELDQADSLRLTVSVLDENDELITGVAVGFASGDTTRVRVSRTGMVRSVGGPGTVTVRVASGTGQSRLSADVPVTIIPVAAAVVVVPDPVEVPQGGSVQLDVTVQDPFGHPLADAQVTFLTLAPTLFSVTGTGLIQAGTASGGGAVRVSSGGVARDVPVAVSAVPTSIHLAPPAVTLLGGESAQVTAEVHDASGAPIPGLVPTLTSSSPATLAVTGPTQVTAPGPAGSGVLTATYGNLSQSIPFSVAEVGIPVGRGIILGGAYAVAISTGGTVYAAVIGGGVARADLPAFALDFVHTPGSSYAAAFRPDGGAAYVTGLAGDDVVTRIDPATDAVVTSSPQLPGTVYDLVVSPDGSRVYAGTGSGHVVALDPATLAVVESRRVSDAYVNHLAPHPSQGLVYASSPGVYSVVELDGATLDITRTFTRAGLWQGLAVSPDGSRLYVANEAGALQSWNLLLGTAAPSLPSATGGFGLRISPDGSTLWMSESSGGRVVRVAVPSGTLEAVYLVGGTPRRIGVRPDGSMVAVANESGYVDFIAP